MTPPDPPPGAEHPTTQNADPTGRLGPRAEVRPSEAMDPESAGPRVRSPRETVRRRTFLRGAAVGSAAWLLAARARANEPGGSVDGQPPATDGHPRSPAYTGPTLPAKAASVIHVHLPGGMAQQESFDPKPFAPAEYRGPFRAIGTSLDGVQFSEVFPRVAKIADRLVVCRSLSHGEAAHERGTHNVFTGYRPSPALVYPSMGSVVAHELGPRENLPPYVCIPRQPNEYAGSGYLSSAYSPFSLGSDPASRGFRVRDLSRPKDVDGARQERRRALLALVDARFKAERSADAIQAVDSFYERAWALIESPEAQEAFDISKEPGKLMDEYGRNDAGLRMLMARRLVEAGVRWVSMTYGAFDHHDNIKRNMQQRAPALDRGFARLVTDLEERGLLESTLVLLTTEFGRTPKINDTDGRDHWPRVFSVVLAGGGLKRGLALGTSNAQGAEPEDDPLTVEDLATTVYHQLGIDAARELMAPGSRPIEIVKGGSPVSAMIA